MTKVFKPMRSIAPDPKFPIRYPMLGSAKLDGIRCCIYDGKAVTKSGKPIPNHFMRSWLEANVPSGFDGELISGSPTLETCYGTTFSAVMTQEGEPEFDFYVFDLCENLTDPALTRKALLSEACAELDGRIKFVTQHLLHSDEEAEQVYDMFLSDGYEGMILVDPAGKYKYGKATAKSQEQLKIKPHADFEAEIIDTYEAEINLNEKFTNEVGESKRSTHADNKTGKGMVGGYRVKDVLTGAYFSVSAGKMLHVDRIAEWEAYLLNPNHRKGSYAKYRAMTYGSMTNNAARHGRWIGWRDVTDMSPEDLGAIA